MEAVGEVLQAQTVTDAPVQGTGIQRAPAAQAAALHHRSVLSLHTDREIGNGNAPAGFLVLGLALAFQHFRIQSRETDGGDSPHNDVPFDDHRILVPGQFCLKVVDAASQKGQQGCKDDKLLFHQNFKLRLM